MALKIALEIGFILAKGTAVDGFDTTFLTQMTSERLSRLVFPSTIGTIQLVRSRLRSLINIINS